MRDLWFRTIPIAKDKEIMKKVYKVLLFLAPLLILLYLLKKDENISKKYRVIAKFFFWYIVFCFLAGAIAEAIALNSL